MFFSLPPIWLVLGNTVLGLAAGAPDKNVVLFMPDDMHFLTGWPEAPPVAGRSTGNIPPASLAPNMNRIRDEGAVFTSAYVAGPKCAPSRFNLLTGRYCSRSSFAIGRAATTGTIDEAGRTVVGVSVQDCKLAGDDLEFTLANQLRAEGGYRTIVAGKWHVASDRGSWDDYPGAVSAVNSSGFTDPAAIYHLNMDTVRDPLPFSHNLEWTTAAANAAIEDAVAAEQSFFLYYAATAPHSPSVLEALARVDGLTETPNGVQPVPDHGHAHTRAEIITAAAGSDGAAGTMWLDDALGSVMAKLETLGALDNTLIIVTMDHGQTAKDTLYQGGARVVMMARLPGAITAGSVVSFPTSHLDIAPTVLAFTGVLPAAGYATDGHSWLGAATEVAGVSPAEARACLVSEIEVDRMVVCDGMGLKLILHLDDTEAPAAQAYPNAADRIQLYDLATDPTEQTNLAGDGAYADAQQYLEAYLECHAISTDPTDPAECDPETDIIDTDPEDIALPTSPAPTPAPTPAPPAPTRGMGGGMGGMNRSGRTVMIRGREIELDA